MRIYNMYRQLFHLKKVESTTTIFNTSTKGQTVAISRHNIAKRMQCAVSSNDDPVLSPDQKTGSWTSHHYRQTWTLIRVLTAQVPQVFRGISTTLQPHHRISGPCELDTDHPVRRAKRTSLIYLHVIVWPRLLSTSTF